MNKVIDSVITRIPILALSLSLMLFVLSLGYAIAPSKVSIILTTMLLAMATFGLYLGIKLLIKSHQKNKSGLSQKIGVDRQASY